MDWKIPGVCWAEAKLPPDLLEQPQVQQVLREIDAHGKILWGLPRQAGTSGNVLQHACKTMDVLRLRFAPFIFKFGISTNAAQRWNHPVYGYELEKTEWRRMLVIYLSPEPFSPAMLEAALIDKYRGALDFC